MTLSEKLKMYRTNNGLSQEKVAELVGVSRQAVTKWEVGQSMPSSEKLIALASIYGTSVDELTEVKNIKIKKDNKILQSNVALIAIILQASALNICIQPFSAGKMELPYTFLILFKLIPLLAFSVWMTCNLKYEKNIVQYRKNVKIELLYCLIQLGVALLAFYSNMLFWGALILIAVALIYIFVINPKYMNRRLTKKFVINPKYINRYLTEKKENK